MSIYTILGQDNIRRILTVPDDNPSGILFASEAACCCGRCPSNSITVVCDQITSFAEKCGFLGFVDSSVIYKAKTTTMSGSFTEDTDIPFERHSTGTLSSSTFETYESVSLEDGVCLYDCDGGGSSSYTTEQIDSSHDPPTTFSLSCSSTNSPCADGWHYTTDYPPDPSGNKSCWARFVTGQDPDNSTTVLSQTQRSGYQDLGEFGAATAYITLTEEYTDEMLQAAAESFLPPYGNNFNAFDCQAIWSAAADQLSLTRFKYKFTWGGIPTGQPFTIHWVLRTHYSATGTDQDVPMSLVLNGTETESPELFCIEVPGTPDPFNAVVNTTTIVDITCTDGIGT